MYLRELIAIIMKRNNGCGETLQWVVLQAELWILALPRLLEQGKGPVWWGNVTGCRSAGCEVFPWRCTQYLPGHRFQCTKGFCASPICFLTTSWFQVLSSGLLVGRWKHFHFYFISTFSHSRIPFTSVTSDRSYELETIKFGFLNSFKYLPQGNSERIKYYRAIVINLCYSKLVGY